MKHDRTDQKVLLCLLEVFLGFVGNYKCPNDILALPLLDLIHQELLIRIHTRDL